jgi:hypothetical protein
MFATGFRPGSRLGLAAVLVATAMSAGLSAAVAAAEPLGPAQALARAIRVQRAHADRLLSRQEVVGLATGVAPDGEYAVKIYTRRRGVGGIPQKLDGVPVVVRATGEIFALRRPPRGKRPRLRRPPPRKPRDRAPTVALVSPTDGQTVWDAVSVAALAADDQGVGSVEFYVDSLFLASDANGADGWSANWDTLQFADGPHSLTATATDTSGQVASDTITVVVDNEPGPFSPDLRPAPIGVSTGNANECSAGTIACRVRDAEGNVYALSNNHVYARMNRAEIGEAILQPGLIDSNCTVVYSDQVIGYLADFVALAFGGRGSNIVDAAIAVSDPEDLGTATPDGPDGGYGSPRPDPVDAFVGQSVQKFGRTTLLTRGQVSGVEATVIVTYGSFRARFTNQIVVEADDRFIDAGDSGSLLVTYSPTSTDGGRDPVGLLFAGSEDGSLAIANPIQPVLDALDVTIDPGP